LFDILFEKIDCVNFKEEEKIIAKYIVRNLDNKGYFIQDIGVIENFLFVEYKKRIGRDVILNILKKVQNMIPNGIAFKNQSEFLIFQLKKKNQDDYVVKTTLNIIEKSFDDFSKGRLKKIAKEYSINNDTLKKIFILLKEMKPYPAYGINVDNSFYKILNPDFFVFKNKDGGFDVKLKSYFNKNIKINNLYKNAIKDEKASDKFISFAKEQIEKAKRFIDVVKRRREVLLQTMIHIVDFQRDYFLSEGEVSFIKPMTLEDIANHIKTSISTVSRIINNKSVETLWDVILLKDFFSGTFFTKDGKPISSIFVEKKIKEILNKESKEKPLSDHEIAKIMQENNINIARRTVTKYRERLGFADSRLRKIF
jgi:RNA polymerase sigma-54 factor